MNFCSGRHVCFRFQNKKKMLKHTFFILFFAHDKFFSVEITFSIDKLSRRLLKKPNGFKKHKGKNP